jgi:hypothetical protein
LTPQSTTRMTRLRLTRAENPFRRAF